MNSALHLVKTPCRGGTADKGEVFDDPLPVGDFSTAAITRIVIRHWCVIDALEVYYSWNKGKGITHGGSGGRKDEFTLEPNEFITNIEGRATDKYIIRLTFVTTKRRWGPYGGTEGKNFMWGGTSEIPGHLESCTRLLAINGFAGHYLNMLQATFAEYRTRENTLKTVRYESMPTPTPTHTGASLTLSKFASHLMAPIVTLFVGQDKVGFHIYEDTLCQLPFFKAALQGQFKEASQKTIDMPEDHSGNVSALIEYLYTGKYTCMYDPHLPGESGVPIGSLAEGLFHVGVYVIAKKYLCPELVEIATRNFEAVLSDLDNIDTLRLWKAAYVEGIQLPSRRVDYDKYRSGEQFVPWVKGLFKGHREEMENTMSEYPGLACDLLRVATGDL